jgi:predicted RNA-binding Zn ribbon-like protein
MNHTEARDKANRYEAWAKQDGLYDALEAIKQGYMQALVQSHVADIQGRENCYIAINLVDKIKGHITKVIGGGKVADKALRDIEKEQTRGKVLSIFR